MLPITTLNFGISLKELKDRASKVTVSRHKPAVMTHGKGPNEVTVILATVPVGDVPQFDAQKRHTGWKKSPTRTAYVPLYITGLGNVAYNTDLDALLRREDSKGVTPNLAKTYHAAVIDRLPNPDRDRPNYPIDSFSHGIEEFTDPISRLTSTKHDKK